MAKNPGEQKTDSLSVGEKRARVKAVAVVIKIIYEKYVFMADRYRI
jgi:hypothetical protein